MWLLNSECVYTSKNNSAQFISLSVDRVHSDFRSEANFDQSSMISMQPFSDSHFIDVCLPSSRWFKLLLLHFQPTASPILQFHYSVARSSANQRDEAQEDAYVDEREFTALKKEIFLLRLLGVEKSQSVIAFMVTVCKKSKISCFFLFFFVILFLARIHRIARIRCILQYRYNEPMTYCQVKIWKILTSCLPGKKNN